MDGVPCTFFSILKVVLVQILIEMILESETVQCLQVYPIPEHGLGGIQP